MVPILGPRRQKKHTQSYRFPCEYWYGPPGKSQSYPASIPALASHRHRSKVKNYDAICFILANDGWKLFCASRRLWRVYTFAQAYLSLRHCTKISCAASDGDFCSIRPGAKTLVSLHICTGVVTGQCNKYQDLSCQRRLWRVCKFTQARLSLVIVPKYHVLARMALGLRLQLGPYCRASFDSKSFHRRTKSSIFNHKSRALPVTLPHTRPVRHIVIVVVVSGIQPTPIG